METIACFKNTKDAEAVSKQLTQNGISNTTEHEDYHGLTLLRSSEAGVAPDSVPHLSTLAKNNHAICCPDCQSAEIQFPEAPEDNWVFPRLVDAIASKLSNNPPSFFCRQCNYTWAPEASFKKQA